MLYFGKRKKYSQFEYDLKKCMVNLYDFDVHGINVVGPFILWLSVVIKLKTQGIMIP